MDSKLTRHLPGWAGIASAVTYLKLNPSIDLTIIDDNTSFGGTWSGERIHPNLVSDSPNGNLEFSDQSLVDQEHPAWVQPIPGQRVHDYLEAYATKYDLHRRTRFETRATHVRRNGEGGWTVETNRGVLECDKLIVALGRSSNAYIPKLPNEGYDGFTMHTKTLGSEKDRDQLFSSKVKDVVVIGAGKSGAEACIAALEADKRVHFIVRNSGKGPPPLLYKGDKAIARLGKIFFSKFFAQLSPSIFNRRGRFYQFLHSGRNKIGSWIVRQFLTKLPIPVPKYDDNPNLLKLKPKYEGFMWLLPGPMILYPDSIFFKALIDGKDLIIHNGDPIKLSKGKLHLGTEEEVPADAIVYSTGWNSYGSFDIFSDADKLDLGLPMRRESKVAAVVSSHWAALDATAYDRVDQLFPLLKTHPKELPVGPARYTAARMFHQILPPSLIARRDRSIIFPGMIVNVQVAIQSELCALWGIAWMEDLHPPSSPLNTMSITQLEQEIALENAWWDRRYPVATPRHGPGLFTEIVTFWDTLMGDLGLRADRLAAQEGRFGWLKEWFTPYMAPLYKDAWRELLANSKKCH